MHIWEIKDIPNFVLNLFYDLFTLPSQLNRNKKETTDAYTITARCLAASVLHAQELLVLVAEVSKHTGLIEFVAVSGLLGGELGSLLCLNGLRLKRN